MNAFCRLAVVAGLLVAGPVGAQDAVGGAQVTKPQRMAADAHPAFEVATIKHSDPDHRNSGFHMNGRHFTIENQPVERMMLFAFGVSKPQIVGAPDWVGSERSDVDGVPDIEGVAGVKQAQEMVRKLLVDRFGLKTHTEQRELPVYALTVAKGGAKMVANTSDPNGWLVQRNGETNRHTETLKNISMPELALILQYHVSRPVVDQTGLKGRWDFTLQWTVDEAKTAAQDAPPGLFTAIQDQIDLKLEPMRAPADVLVVDAVQKPGAN